MRNFTLLFFTIFAALSSAFSQESDTATIDYAKIEKSMKYQTGSIELERGNATLKVPRGFRFLDAKQTQYVLRDLWGNPDDKTVLGALVPENKGVTYDDSWLFVINYEDMGYVKDDDAKDIDYSEMLVEMQKDMVTSNEERKKAGFESVQLIGWASKPYYDDRLKVLHWAKELKFGDSKFNTLNYDLRVLGRKGVYTLSAVSSMSQLAEVRQNIPNILGSVQFKDDFKYDDFDSDVDSVAAWTIGGLVAGKVLAKVGFFAIILKFGKFIGLGILAAWAAFKKFLSGKKEHETTRPVPEIAETTDPEEENK